MVQAENNRIRQDATHSLLTASFTVCHNLSPCSFTTSSFALSPSSFTCTPGDMGSECVASMSDDTPPVSLRRLGRDPSASLGPVICLSSLFDMLVFVLRVSVKRPLGITEDRKLAAKLAGDICGISGQVLDNPEMNYRVTW